MFAAIKRLVMTLLVIAGTAGNGYGLSVGFEEFNTIPISDEYAALGMFWLGGVPALSPLTENLGGDPTITGGVKIGRAHV